MNITAIIQARMGSSRFPAKMSEDLFGYPIIDWVIRRLKKSKYPNKIFLATSTSSKNLFLKERAKALDISFYEGSENDVLSRFYKIAKNENSDVIVRICGDNPFICFEHVDKIIELFIEKFPDYAFNHIPALDNKYVDGIGAEVFSARTLNTLKEKSITPMQKEHVTKYIWENVDDFEILTLKADKKISYPQISLDVDTINDLIYLKKLVRAKLKIKKSKPEDIIVSEILN